MAMGICITNAHRENRKCTKRRHQRSGVMQVFHWSRQASNYAFLESRDQCLHGQLRLVASYQPVGEIR